MKKAINYFKNNWITLLIVSLPILDILTYFFINTKISGFFTILRFLILPIIFIYSYIITNKRSYHYIFSAVVGVYCVCHIISCCISSSGYLNILEDLSNMLRILYMPILLFSFYFIFKSNKNSEEKVIKGIKLAFYITIVSIFISLLTNTANYTYGHNIDSGIIGWFYSKNSQSMILVTLCIITGIYSIKRFSFYPISILIFLALYFNATKTAYLSLLVYLLFCIFFAIFELKNVKKVTFTVCLLLCAIFFYNISPTKNHIEEYTYFQDSSNEIISNFAVPSNNEEVPSLIIEEKPGDDLKKYEDLYRKYSLGPLIDNFGVETVLNKYNYSMDAYVLSNTRTKKKTAAKLLYENENTFSHLFGFEFTKINEMDNNENGTLDLENDITAIFYYCGYVGFALYFGFILYWILRLFTIILKKPKYILKSDYMVWLFLIALLLFGCEFNGGLLRRPSTNIYLAIIISLATVKFEIGSLKAKKTSKNDELKNNNIAIFVNNLNVGGIQKSIVNLLNNIDCSKYNIDLYIFEEETFYDIPQKVNIIILKKPSSIYKFMPFNLVKKILNVNVLDKEYNVAIDFDSYQMYTAIGALSCNAQKKAIWIHNDISIKIQEEFKYRILHSFFKKKYVYFDIFCAVSQGAMDSFKKIEDCNNKKCLVIPNYINTLEIENKMVEKCDLKVDKDKLNIVSVGRLCHQKGFDIMLKNINELRNYRTDFHLYLIGDGPDKNKLLKLVDYYKLNHYVTFLGNQKNPYKFLKKMDLFYLSSRYEGQGMVILEAKAAGLKVLIPKHLEKYCPEIVGVEDVLEYLKKCKKNQKKQFDKLEKYNNEIIDKVEMLFELEK